MPPKQVICDICKKGDERKTLLELRPMYQTYDIKFVCHGCGELMDKYLIKLRNLERGKFQIFWRWSLDIWRTKMRVWARFNRIKFKKAKND